MTIKQQAARRREKIAGVEVPPSYSEALEYGEVSMALYRQLDEKKYGFDSKGRYLHWDEFRVRFPEFNANRIHAWWALKLKRRLVAHANLSEFSYVQNLFSHDPTEADAIHSARHFLFHESALLGKLSKVDRLSTSTHLRLDETTRKHYLSRQLIMEEAISSAQLEGATTTRPIAKAMLESGRKPRDFSEQMIVNNYRLLQAALESLDEPLSIELIKKFNQVATEEVCENGHIAGELRQSAIDVAENMTGDVIHHAPDHQLIELMLQNLCLYANREHLDADFIHPIVKAIVLHFMVGFIHPFLDGNGRTARALFYWYAIKKGYPNFQHISISALLKAKPKQYARAYVYTETDELDLTYFVDFNLDIVIAALEKFNQYIDNKVNALNRVIEELHTSPFYREFSLHHIEIIKKSLKTAGRTFTVQEIAADFNVSAPAARSYLDSLAKQGLLIKYTIKGRLNGYIAPADLRSKLKIEPA